MAPSGIGIKTDHLAAIPLVDGRVADRTTAVYFSRKQGRYLLNKSTEKARIYWLFDTFYGIIILSKAKELYRL